MVEVTTAVDVTGTEDTAGALEDVVGVGRLDATEVVVDFNSIDVNEVVVVVVVEEKDDIV